jgi:hypothetical protein
MNKNTKQRNHDPVRFHGSKTLNSKKVHSKLGRDISVSKGQETACMVMDPNFHDFIPTIEPILSAEPGWEVVSCVSDEAQKKIVTKWVSFTL